MKRLIFVTIAKGAMCLFALTSTASETPRMTKEQVLQIAIDALNNKDPGSYTYFVEKYGKFDAKLDHGVWMVEGTKPLPGIRGGGGPVIEVRDSDGKVLRIYFNR